jgi:hypothetical protein
MSTARPAVKYSVVSQAKRDGRARAVPAARTVHTGNRFTNLLVNPSPAGLSTLGATTFASPALPGNAAAAAAAARAELRTEAPCAVRGKRSP